MKKLDAENVGGNVVSECVPNFEAIEQIALPPRPFVMFVAADARTVSVDIVARVAARLLAAGVTVVSAWGPDCERVHDIFDEQYVGDGNVEPSSELMTTWHDDESLEDAVEFFALSGKSLAGADTPMVSQLTVAVGNKAWAATIEDVLGKQRHVS